MSPRHAQDPVGEPKDNDAMTENESDLSAVSLAEVEDAKLANKERSSSQGRLVWKRFLRHKPAMISAVIFLFLVVVSLTSVGIGGIPGWWKYAAGATGTPIDGGAPSAEHWFGQDDLGRDYFGLTMRGAQASIIIAFLVGIVGTVVGTAVGALAGYYRGWLDAILMRLTDMFFVVPTLLIAAIVGVIASGAVNSPWFLGTMLGLVAWPGLARLVRSQVLSLREREYVDAARAMGAGTWRIILRHLIPNAIGTILVNATLAIAAGVLLETALSYLGFGVQAPESSLGLLISEYQNSFTTRPWLFWWPGLMILIIALSVNFIGDGLRDAFDPRQGGKRRRRLLKFEPVEPAKALEGRAGLAGTAAGAPGAFGADPVRDAAADRRSDPEHDGPSSLKDDPKGPLS